MGSSKTMTYRASVYILRCSDGSYYTGITRREIAERMDEHQRGADRFAYTFSRRPVEIVWCTHFERIDEAIETERRIKRWNRAKKEALIQGDYDALPALASRSRRKKKL